MHAAARNRTRDVRDAANAHGDASCVALRGPLKRRRDLPWPLPEPTNAKGDLRATEAKTYGRRLGRRRRGRVGGRQAGGGSGRAARRRAVLDAGKAYAGGLPGQAGCNMWITRPAGDGDAEGASVAWSRAPAYARTAGARSRAQSAGAGVCGGVGHRYLGRVRGSLGRVRCATGERGGGARTEMVVNLRPAGGTPTAKRAREGSAGVDDSTWDAHDSCLLPEPSLTAFGSLLGRAIHLRSTRGPPGSRNANAVQTRYVRAKPGDGRRGGRYARTQGWRVRMRVRAWWGAGSCARESSTAGSR
ncbi:hypothetical protein C2E23DRAFT_383740 [Lenzites betulinus]|nr:hypothetical protein C2E23DRAFT_383740 [Lenzites betulinus]